MLGVVATLLSTLALAQTEASTTWKIPYKGDEIALVEVKANPEQYVGKTFIICGCLGLDDYYNFSYWDAKDTHYSLSFFSWGKDNLSRGNEHATLYLSKQIDAPIVDIIVRMKKRAESDGTEMILLARAKVTFVPARFAKYKEWSTMEVLDVQFMEKDHKGWWPWIVEKVMAEESAQRAAIEKRKIEERDALNREREQAKMAKAPKFRTWIYGEKHVTAKFKNAINQTVKLVLENGTTMSVPLDELSPADQWYIKNRATQ